MSSVSEREIRKWGLQSPDHFQEAMRGNISDRALEDIMKEVDSFPKSQLGLLGLIAKEVAYENAATFAMIAGAALAAPGTGGASLKYAPLALPEIGAQLNLKLDYYRDDFKDLPLTLWGSKKPSKPKYLGQIYSGHIPPKPGPGTYSGYPAKGLENWHRIHEQIKGKALDKINKKETTPGGKPKSFNPNWDRFEDFALPEGGGRFGALDDSEANPGMMASDRNKYGHDSVLGAIDESAFGIGGSQSLAGNLAEPSSPFGESDFAKSQLGGAVRDAELAFDGERAGGPFSGGLGGSFSEGLGGSFSGGLGGSFSRGSADSPCHNDPDAV